MKFKTQEVVRGATRFAGDIDGESIKSGYVMVDVSMDAEGKGWGYRTEAMKVKDLAIIDGLVKLGLPWPVLCELEVEQTATRNKSQLVVVGITPIKQHQAPKAA